MTHRLYIVLFMVCVSAVFGGIVTALHLAAQDTIEQNRHLKRQQQLLELFDLGDPEELSAEECARRVEEQISGEETLTDPKTGNTIGVMRVYSDPQHSHLKAYGLRFRGLGFWAPIEGILAITADRTRTRGMVVLEQQETPGLGGRITEQEYRKQFAMNLDISPPQDRDAPYLSLAGTAFEPEPGDRRFSAITGATQTSMAMERILNDALATFHRTHP